MKKPQYTTLNTTNAVGKNLRDMASTRSAVYLPSRAAGAASATAAEVGVDDARGLPLATPSVLPPTVVLPADDVDDDDVSLSVVRSVDDDDALWCEEPVPDAAGDQKLVTLATSELTSTLRYNIASASLCET